jgi:hypothetical protein
MIDGDYMKMKNEKCQLLILCWSNRLWLPDFIGFFLAAGVG